MYLTNNQNPGRLVNNLYPCSWWWHIRCLPLGIGIWFFRFEFTQWFGISRNRCKLYTLTSEVVAQICCTRQAILTDTKTWFCWMVGWSLLGFTKQFNSDFRRAAHCQWPMAEHIPYAIKLKEHRIKVYPNLGEKKHVPVQGLTNLWSLTLTKGTHPKGWWIQDHRRLRGWIPLI